MNTRYGAAVFDEWAVISMRDKGGRLSAYSGPRKEDFQKSFATDFGALREGLASRPLGVGDFEFARHGSGTRFDAFLVLGDGHYLICNNTRSSMDLITKEPRWLGAQVPFVELSDKIRVNPVAMKS
jgi:hypothetical protein